MPPKPPKPKDRPPSPRTKKRDKKRDSTMGLRSAIDAVTALSRSDPSEEDFEKYIVETNAEKNDRGAAILLATNLENALKFAIANILEIPEERRKELFGQETSPCGTFSSKIILAHSIGIFLGETRHNLDIVRVIRNAFAHAKIPITFDTKSILDACAFLKLPRQLLANGFRPAFSKEVDQKITGRKRFQQVCENTTHNLIRISVPSKLRILVPSSVASVAMSDLTCPRDFGPMIM